MNIPMRIPIEFQLGGGDVENARENILINGGLSMSPQCEAIFNHLLRGGTISTLEAMRDFGCCRLSERIAELERTGINITHTWVKVGKKRFMRYSYHAQPQQLKLVG